MEYVPGKSLDKAIARGRGMPVAEAIRYAEQIAGALAAAHAAGIVHRDLKPANVMLADSGQVKILDFGLAKLTAAEPRANPASSVSAKGESETVSIHTPLTMDGSIVGTANYMSPEQAQGKSVDARSDIFSFGAVLYEMFTGSRAFEGETTVATLAAILRDEVPPLRSRVPEAPPHLEHAIAKCLRKDPAGRWQSMGAVQAALSGASAISGEAAVPVVAEPLKIAGPPKIVTPPKLIRYGGFWMRAAARIIDAIIIGMALSVLRFLLHGLPLVRDAAFVLFAGCCYELFFVTTRGATIGKLALNLKIVTQDGSPITRRRALGRYCAMAISAITLIGFPMAGFDREKRALHDRICGTRVVDS
jgi:uncharacterized RDD family membrane protein YckC